MSAGRAEAQLRVALVAVGVVFAVGIWPLTRIWPSGWSWHTGGESFYLTMILAIYFTLGVFLVRASRAPRDNLGLIWFTVWSSVAHALVMAVQSFSSHDTMGHLYGDVPALLIVAAVLGVLTRRAGRRVASEGT